MVGLKIAIPCTGNSVEAEVFEHFGRAPYYCILTVDENEIRDIEFYKNPAIEEHAPGDIPSFLHSKGVNVLIAMGVGRRAIYYFNELGIEVITGASGKIIDVVKRYIKGELESVPYEPSRKWHEEN